MHRSVTSVVALSLLVATGCGAPGDAAPEAAPAEAEKLPPTETVDEPEAVAEAWTTPDLTPEAVPGDADAAAPFRFGFAFVIHAGEPMVVLGTSNTEAGATAEVVSADDAWVVVRRRRIAEALLEDEARAWVGQRVALHGVRGVRCEASIAEPWLVDRMERERGDETQRQTLIAGALVLSPDCGEAHHATPLTFASRVYTPVDTTTIPGANARVRRAVTALRALPGYAALQAEYERGEWSAGKPPAGSFEHHEDSGITVTFFTEPGGRSLLVTTLWAGAGCGGFQANLSATFEELPSGLVPRAVEAGSSAIPELLVESGGELAMVHGDWASIPASGVAVDIRPPTFSCGC